MRRRFIIVEIHIIDREQHQLIINDSTQFVDKTVTRTQKILPVGTENTNKVLASNPLISHIEREAEHFIPFEP